MQIVRYDENLGVKEIVQVDELTGEILIFDSNLALKESAKIDKEDD